MKILVRFNKNIAIPRQVKSFKLFDLGIVSTTIDDLLDSTTIEIDDQTLPILKINNSSFIEYYLINDLGLTPGYSYPYYTDDFMKEITISDLVLINNGQMGEENIQSDWNQINTLADDFIKNKPELFSGDYNDLINQPVLISNHSELNLDDGTNPHGTTKNDVGLGNVDNTSDLLKPISTATQTALNGKANTIHSHVISDVTGLQTALISKLDKVTSSGVERAYIINADGSQGTKATSEFGVLETKNKLIIIPLGDLGVAIEDVTYEMVSDYINNLGIVVGKGENYYFEVIEVLPTYNFDLTSPNWASEGVTDEASFINWLATRSYEIDNDLTNIVITDFNFVGDRIFCNMTADGTIYDLSDLGLVNADKIGIVNGLISLGLSSNQIVTFNPSIVLPSSLTILNLKGNQMTLAGYTASEVWANSQPAFTNPCNVYFSSNIDSITGTNLKAILITKNCIITA